jgi:hypothetical protein
MVIALRLDEIETGNTRGGTCRLLPAATIGERNVVAQNAEHTKKEQQS